MIKRLFVIVCCMALLVFQGAAGAAETGGSYALPDGAGIVSLVPQSEDTLMVESHHQLLLLHSDTMQAEQATPKPPYESAMVAYDDAISAVSIEGMLLSYEGGSWEIKGELDVQDANRVIWAQRIGDRIFASFAMEGSAQAMIAAYDSKTKTSQTVAEAFGNGWFYPVDGHTLGSLRQDGEQWLHCVIDLDSKAISESPVKSLPIELRAFSYLPSSGQYYLAAADGILYGKDLNELKRFSQQGGVSDVVPLQGDRAALRIEDKIYIRQPQSGEAFTLKVMGIDPPLGAKYYLETGIKVEGRQTAGGSTEDIATMLYSKDDSVDLFCLFSDGGLGKIKEKGLFADLSVSQTLRSAKDDLYPSIARRLSGGESELMAWPVYMESWFTRADRELLGKYGFDTPETFDALIELLPKIAASGMLQEEGARMFDIMPYSREDMLAYFIQQYLFAMDSAGQKPDFSNKDVMRILQKITENIPVEDPNPSEDGTESPLFSLATVSSEISDELLAGFGISKDQPPAVWSRILVMVVNPFSTHKEEAISYLEFLSKNRGRDGYAMYASMKDPLPNPQALAEIEALQSKLDAFQAQQEGSKLDEAIAQTKAELKELEASRYLVSPESIARYQTLAGQLYISEDASLLYNDDLRSVIAQLAQGNIGLEGFAERMNQLVKLIYLEKGL